ncbi:MAG TPA: hydantoinase/oxoprolinase family protein [Thermoanaerobacterales bacterium]|nr:hydantoinase/oxoprolinase family protein [Thermoanaerobacterales bacterium]
MIVGLDMGGTHVDAVLIHQGEIIEATKSPTDRSNLLESVWGTLKSLLSRQDPSQIKRIILSTTISTNAIIEQKTDPVGMIIECGPGLQNDFLCCGWENIFISGYIDHRGREISPVDQLEIKKAVRTFKRQNIPAVAVTGKFSVRNAEHEVKISEMLKDEFSPITLGHTLSGKLNFPRRVFTSYYNSAVYTTFSKFSESICKALKREKISAPIYVLKADGGTMSLKAGEKYPVNTILSGPAASVMGGQAFLETSKDAIFLDIGGTTTDISFLADGVPLFEPLGIKIGDFPTLVRALYSVSIGVGGDSRVGVKNQTLVIGPERQGPPKALGGACPTPTDAMIVLGLIDIGDKHKAVNAMKEIGGSLNLGPEATANIILDTMANMIKNKVEKQLHEINSHPVYTVKELLYGKKIKPAFVQVIGGPAEAMAVILEKKFGIPCRYPKVYKAANAVGAALARTTAEITMFVDTAQKTLSVPEMGLYKKVSRGYNLEESKLQALDLLKRQSTLFGAKEGEIQAEIVEENSFNMVRGFTTSGKNIRIRAQTKPGLIHQLRSDEDVSC